MGNLLRTEIRETAEDLKQQLRTQTTAQGKERLQMLYGLKTGMVTTRQELARRLARNESSVYRWLEKYRRGGVSALVEVKTAPGKAPKIPAAALERLRQRLAQPKGFSSYGEIQQWLATECGVEAAYKTVHQTVRYKLKSKLKVPRPRSNQAELQVHDGFKKNSHIILKVPVAELVVLKRVPACKLPPKPEAEI